MKPYQDSLLREFVRSFLARGYDWHGSPPVRSKLRRLLCYALPALAFYLIVPLTVFDFTEAAYPFDEEYFNGHDVAIGPRPYDWVPHAIHGYDIPGGADYTEEAWPFVVWKPLCVLYCRMKGYELPRSWRQ